MRIIIINCVLGNEETVHKDVESASKWLTEKQNSRELILSSF